VVPVSLAISAPPRLQAPGTTLSHGQPPADPKPLKASGASINTCGWWWAGGV